MNQPFPEFNTSRMTWLGHEFLDAARDEGIWTRTISSLKEKTGAMSFDVLFKLLKTAILKGVGDRKS